MVSPFDALDGILEVRSGYMGGHIANPTYKDVKSQASGHYEAIRVRYDPDAVSYETLAPGLLAAGGPDGRRRPVPGPRTVAASDRDLLRHRRTARGGRGVESGDGRVRALPGLIRR